MRQTVRSMKLLFFFFATILFAPALAQSFDQRIDKQETPNSIGFSLNIPMGSFSSTHTIGFALDYTRSTRRRENDTVTYKLIHFAMNGGVSYHGGKRTTTAGYESTYGGYINIYAMAGIDCKPSMPIIINLMTGPVMSIYEGNGDLGFGVNLFSNYYLSRTLTLGPGILFRKFEKTDALWTAIFRASYSF